MKTRRETGPSSAAAEIIVEIYAGTRTTNISLQDFVQLLDYFEIKLNLFVIICNCGTYNCHFPFVLCCNR